MEDAMKWVTRANVKVDRVACPWLIRTFVDPGAEFLFVPVDQVDSVVRTNGAIPYDTLWRGARSSWRRMLVRCHRKEVPNKRRGDQPSGGHRAWCRYKAAGSNA